jgi:hypothetical protein
MEYSNSTLDPGLRYQDAGALGAGGRVNRSRAWRRNGADACARLSSPAPERVVLSLYQRTGAASVSTNAATTARRIARSLYRLIPESPYENGQVPWCCECSVSVEGLSLTRGMVARDAPTLHGEVVLGRGVTARTGLLPCGPLPAVLHPNTQVDGRLPPTARMLRR